MAKKIAHCTAPDCDRKIFGHGLCNKHYQQTRSAERRLVPATGEKRCCKCKDTKPIEAFNFNSNTKDGHRPECKDCSADYHRTNRHKYGGHKSRQYSLKKNFQMTHDDYLGMFERQDGKCAICQTTKPGSWGQYLCIDHDHATGKVRGLLCNSCNTGLGFFKDDVTALSSAIRYLSRS